MKKLFFLGTLFVLVAAGLILRKDEWVSSYFSQKLGIHIRVRGIRMPQFGHIAFSGLEAQAAKGGQEWFRADKGIIYAASGGFRAQFENVAPEGPLKKGAASLSAWLKKSGGLLPGVDRADVWVRERGGSMRVRIIRASGQGFLLTGGMHAQNKRLEKMNLRLVMTGPEAPRVLGLAFGGATWTLRGSSGPLLQFSGEFV